MIEESASPRRLDLLLLERGLATTRTKAQSLIEAGKVSVNGKVVRKSGEKVAPDCELALSAKEHPFVSRGGLKLGGALDQFGIVVSGRRALDVGQSTGGFTDCLLSRGASEVVGVDVGTGQLAPSLREDPRVRFFEKQDIRTLRAEQVAPAFALFVADLSFVSLRLIIPFLPPFLEPNAEGILLVKPQFEVGAANIGSGGIVRDAAARERALEDVRLKCGENGFTVAGVIPSPVAGGDGNLEFLLHVRWISQGDSI